MREISIIFYLFIIIGVVHAQEWRQTIGPYSGKVSQLKINSKGHIFAGGSSDGLYQSTDDGTTWFRAGLDGKYVTCLELTRNGDLYAVTAFYESQYVLYRSTNEGLSWTQLLQTKNELFTLTVNDSGNIFVGTWSDDTLYKSTNYGSSWKKVKVSADTIWEPVITSLTISATGKIFAAAQSGWGARLYNSIDNGESWAPTSLTSFEISFLVFATNHTCFVGTSDGLYKSTDEGSTWINIFDSSGVSVIAMDNSNGLVIAKLSTFYGSTDNGNSWNRIKFPLLNITSLLLDSQNHLFVGTEHSGLFKSIDHGITWLQTGVQDAQTYSVLMTSYGTMLAGTAHAGVYLSTNKGYSWKWTGLDVPVECFQVDSSGNILAGTDFGVFCSTNDGNSWSSMGPNEIVQSLVISKSGYLLAGCYWFGIFRSTDKGVSWSQGGFLYNTNSLAVDIAGDVFLGSDYAVYRSIDEGNTFAITSLQGVKVRSIVTNKDGQIFAGVNGGIYLSEDHGATWKNVGFVGHDVYSLAINSDNIIFAGTGIGVFRSTDTGTSWSIFQDGLTDPLVFSFSFDNSGNLYAATRNGVGITLETSLDVLNRDPKYSNSFTLYQNYPNPWNPSTHIRYDLPRNSSVILTIYNIAGQKVKELVNQEQQSGYHEVIFHGDGIPSGVYFYRLTTGFETDIRKMLLIH